MKKSFMLSTLLIAMTGSIAAAQSTQTQGQQTNAASTSLASNAGNAQNILIEANKIPADTTTTVNYSGTQTVRNVPSINASPLTSSNDTCMGSATGAVSGPGFGLSIGKTYVDDNCVMLKNSRELWNMGMKAASLALMCADLNNRAALELTGYVCPRVEERPKLTSAPANVPVAFLQNDGNYTDPIIRARLGLK